MTSTHSAVMAAHRIESLKAADPLAWIQRMNSIQARVREIIYAELIYQ